MWSTEVGIQRRIEGHKDLVFAHEDDGDDVVVGTEAEDPSSSAILDWGWDAWAKQVHKNYLEIIKDEKCFFKFVITNIELIVDNGTRLRGL